MNWTYWFGAGVGIAATGIADKMSGSHPGPLFICLFGAVWMIVAVISRIWGSRHGKEAVK